VAAQALHSSCMLALLSSLASLWQAGGISLPQHRRASKASRELVLVQGVANSSGGTYGGDSEASCTELQNMQSHFTVGVEVGPAAQKFQIVADTGSDALILPSCDLCTEAHKCGAISDCYHDSEAALASTEGLYVMMAFGSGTITAKIATDTVRVGGAQATMEEGLLLMVDRRLDISGPFEGILGLGVPMYSPGGAGVRGNTFISPSFILEAGVQRFSVCYNDDELPGVLRFGPPPAEVMLRQVGRTHWGLGLTGVSVGDAEAPARVCSEAAMLMGMNTPCGAIPDSGTTLIMAPAAHITALFGEICGRWPRCSALLRASNATGSEAFMRLLGSCEDWLDGQGGLEEVPSIFFHVAGADGKRHAVELTSWAYITEALSVEVAAVTQRILGVFPVEVWVPTGRARTVCVPSFGEMDYPTALNGPTWILGLPLFFQLQVQFQMHPPSIGFSTGACGSCAEDPALIARGGAPASGPGHAVHRTRGRAWRLRRSTGPPRVPHFNTSQPL